MLETDVTVPVASKNDVLAARQETKALAAQLGFDITSTTLVTTAVSELARNIINYAGYGVVTLRTVTRDGQRGLEVVAHDDGPGIADVELAMQDGYSTSGGLGLGLPGSRRLMDEFTIDSRLGHGTTVTARKWVPS